MTNILTKKDIDDLENYINSLSDDDKYSQISSINEEEIINYKNEKNIVYSNYLENLINANNKIIKQTNNFIYKENEINRKNKFKREMINNILNGINNLESMINNFKK
jgi:hypothetical protein